jgi:hypothetical protein
VTLLEDPLFGIGVMLDSFHSFGNLPTDNVLLKSSERDEQILDAQCLKSVAGILSGPDALF